MSTHAYVGIENSDGSVTYMYVHFDGYIEDLGRKLAPLTRDEAKAFIQMGDSRTLGEPFIDDDQEGPRKSLTVARYLSSGTGNVSYTYLISRRGAWRVAKGSGPWTSLKQALKAVDK